MLSLSNVLSRSKSPYLLQHKNNPVHWQLWDRSIFELSKKYNKPILLSVGYASCHWCHVMAHESFEDLETSVLMNQNFINVKVDREERPDVDFIFQTCHQIFNHRGGWPLTMFLDENGYPFMAGTYFPKEEKYGMPPFKDVLKQVSEIYSTDKSTILQQGPKFKEYLTIPKSSVTKQNLDSFIDRFISELDSTKGGFKGAPKFPILYIYDSIFHFYKKNKSPEYLKAVDLILYQLCSQGIYDQVEGGIARYSVDDQWLVPHFEKMLYDNVQFITLLANYLIIKPDPYFEKKLRHTINFFLKNFRTKENLMGSALDADSDGVEGKYYVFDYEWIKGIQDIDKYYDVYLGGNWEGKIILKESQHKISAPNQIQNALLAIRNVRNKPFFDDKAQLDLNCFFVSSLIKASKALKDPELLNEAKTIFNNIQSYFFKENLFHCYSDNVFLEDYAYTIQCLMDLYDESLMMDYKIKARKFAKDAISFFYDKQKKYFQKNTIHTNDIFTSALDVADHNIGNGNSIMLTNFLRIGFLNEAKELASSMHGYVNMHSQNMASSIKALDIFEQVIQSPNCSEEGCKI